mgnify:CR=1 FL=1
MPELELAAFASSIMISCSKIGSAKAPAVADCAPNIVSARTTAAICFILPLNAVCRKNDKLDSVRQGNGW